MILMMPMMASDHKQSLPYEWWVMLAWCKWKHDWLG
jgi:hypothetical protein